MLSRVLIVVVGFDVVRRGYCGLMRRIWLFAVNVVLLVRI